MDWEVDSTSNWSKWKIGLWVWRTKGEWRLRYYRPWRQEFFEITCEKFLLAVYILGIGAGWWKDVVWDETSKAEKLEAKSGQGLEKAKEKVERKD